MTDHFSLTVALGDLDAAVSQLGTIGTELDGQGGRLAGLPGKATSWTGGTADVLKGEMSRIGRQMQQASPLFGDAKSAVSTFRQAVEEAQNVTLPALNKRWTAAQGAHDDAVTKATNGYATEVKPYQHMPDSDSYSMRQAAATTRDSAISSAGTALAAAQRGINSDYDTMVSHLQTAARTCGSSLAAAVLAAVPADVVDSFLKGGGTGTVMPKNWDLDALTVSTRQALTGDDSLAGQADDYAAGKKAAEAAQGWLKDHPYDPMPQAIADALKANSTNKAFVQALMVTMGPSGMARIAGEVKDWVKNGKDKDGSFFKAMSQIFGTGSYLQVDNGLGGTKYLMDADWLNQFSPVKADPKTYQQTEPKDVYRPDLLLPFLRDKNSVSDNFAGIVADRALTDYEAWQKGREGDDMNAFAHIQWYLGDPASYSGNPWATLANSDPKDPFGPVFGVALARASDYTDVSNSVLMAHFKTLAALMTGQDPFWTGGDTYLGDQKDWISGPLADILKQGTSGFVKEHPDEDFLADSVVSQLGAYLKDNGDQHLLGSVNKSLTDVLLDPRYLKGLENSVGTPFAPGIGDYDPLTGAIDDPKLGPLMPMEIWQALHREAMRDPANAAAITTQLGSWIRDTEHGAQHMGYTYDASGNLVQSPTVSSMDFFRAESMRTFLAGNLSADAKAIQDALNDALKDNQDGKDQATAVMTTLFGYATDPSSIKDDLIGKAGDFVIGQLVDAFSEDPKSIADKYQPTIDALNKLANDPVVKPSAWDDIQSTATQLAVDEKSGTGANTVNTPQPGYGPTDPAHSTTHTGDPTQYVGHTSTSDEWGHVQTDDFLTYDAQHNVTGVMNPGDMNTMQRNAYLNWLEDPAVQAYLDKNDDAVSTGRGRANQ